jgi:hypothetical protein
VKEKIISDYSQLVGRINAIKAKYERPTVELTESLAPLSTNIIDKATGEVAKYPVVRVDKESYRSRVLSGMHEYYENKFFLFGLSGVFAGAVLGLMTFGLINFLKQNQGRLRVIFAGSNQR